jgi:glyoxylase I family protein
MTATDSHVPTTKLQHVAIRVRDIPRTLKFYIDGLGFKRHTVFGGAPKIEIGEGSFLELFPSDQEAPEDVGTIVHFAILTDDCDAAVEVARSVGAEVVMEPKYIDQDSEGFPTRRIAFCKGPDGEQIEFVEVVVD